MVKLRQLNGGYIDAVQDDQECCGFKTGDIVLIGCHFIGIVMGHFLEKNDLWVLSELSGGVSIEPEAVLGKKTYCEFLYRPENVKMNSRWLRLTLKKVTKKYHKNPVEFLQKNRQKTKESN